MTARCLGIAVPIGRFAKRTGLIHLQRPHSAQCASARSPIASQSKPPVPPAPVAATALAPALTAAAGLSNPPVPPEPVAATAPPKAAGLTPAVAPSPA